MRNFPQVFPNTRHIVVLRGSDIFKVDVLNEQFRCVCVCVYLHACVYASVYCFTTCVPSCCDSPLAPEAIEAQIRGILALPVNNDPSVSVATLTSNERDTWARVRSGMETSKINKCDSAWLVPLSCIVFRLGTMLSFCALDWSACVCARACPL